MGRRLGQLRGAGLPLHRSTELLRTCRHLPQRHPGAVPDERRPLNLIKEVPATLERGRWYTFKVDARGGHFTAYLDGKQMFAADDGSLAKGRIGIWSQNDSKVSFDNIKLTPAAAGSSPSA